MFAGYGTVVNSGGGLISGYDNGVDFERKGVFGGGKLTNDGTILGVRNGAYFYVAGIIANSGIIRGTGTPSVTGQPSIGVLFAAAGTLDNFGTILGDPTGGIGANLANGGTISNSAGGVISGREGVVMGNGGTKANAGTLENSGVILGAGTSGTGVRFNGYGIVTNLSSGLISGPGIGVLFDQYGGGLGGGRIINFGTIDGSGKYGFGVVFFGGGLLSNTAGGMISGGAVGIQMEGNGALISISNSGTIQGTDGVYTEGVAFIGGGELSAIPPTA